MFVSAEGGPTMAKVMKREHEHHEGKGALAPFLAGFPAMPRWMDEMLLDRWPPFAPMLRFAEELGIRAPPVDVYEEGDDIVVKAELPGMKKEEIEVDVTGDLVTLSGKKEKEEKIERKDYHRLERATGSFSRTVRLPAEVVLDKVTAAFKDGVLEVRAPKAHAEKVTARKVEVG
jgi:HSP20 family protein